MAGVDKRGVIHRHVARGDGNIRVVTGIDLS